MKLICPKCKIEMILNEITDYFECKCGKKTSLETYYKLVMAMERIGK